MKVYLYDNTIKEYTGEYDAFESPLEPGVFHYPVDSTDIKPCLTPTGKVCIFNVSKKVWELVEDNRGEVYVKSTGELISDYTQLGKLPDELTNIKKPNENCIWEDDNWVIDESLTKKVDKLLSIRNIVVTTSSGKSFDGDEDSQNRIIRALNRTDATIKWKLANNTISDVTIYELQEALDLESI